MCLFGSPQPAQAPAMLPEMPKDPPNRVDPEVQARRRQERLRAVMGSNITTNVGTSPLGLPNLALTTGNLKTELGA